MNTRKLTLISLMLAVFGTALFLLNPNSTQAVNYYQELAGYEFTEPSETNGGAEVLSWKEQGYTAGFVVREVVQDGFNDDLFTGCGDLDTNPEAGDIWLFLEIRGPDNEMLKEFGFSECLQAQGYHQDFAYFFQNDNGVGIRSAIVDSYNRFEDGNFEFYVANEGSQEYYALDISYGADEALQWLIDNDHASRETNEEDYGDRFEPRPTICVDGFIINDDREIPIEDLCADPDHGGVLVPGYNWAKTVADCIALKQDNPNLANIQTIDCELTAEAIAEATEEFEQEKYCTGLVLGWILCPIIDGLYSSLLWTFENMFEPLLFISPLDNTDNDPNNPQNAVYDIWNNFRVIANIAFVIIFFFAIAANSFGFLLTPYDFKKTMPRLAIGFIGVQISFYVCGWLIDIFNILGAGIRGLITAPIHDFTVALDFDLDVITEGVVAFALAKGTISTVALAGGIKGLIGLLPMVLVPLLLFLISAVVVLLLRQVVILLLAILSPIAFVAWVLPNTESVTKFWAETFIKVLAMFPLIMIFISVGELFAAIVINEDSTALMQIAGVVALFAPYVMIPATFKLAGSAIGSLASGFSDMRKTVNNRLFGDLQDPGSYRSTQRNIRNKYRTQRAWQRYQDFGAARKNSMFKPGSTYKGIRDRQRKGVPFGRSRAAMRTWKAGYSPISALSTYSMMRFGQPIDERQAARTRQFKSNLKDLLEYGRDDYIYALFGDTNPLTGERLDADAINNAVKYRDDDSFLTVGMTYVLAKARSEKERQAYINAFANSDQIAEGFKPGIWKGASFGNQSIYRDLKHRDFMKLKDKKHWLDPNTPDFGLIKDGKITDYLREGVDVMNSSNLFRHGESYWHGAKETADRLKDVLYKKSHNDAKAATIEDWDTKPESLARNVSNLASLRHGMIENLARGRLGLGETAEEAFEHGAGDLTSEDLGTSSGDTTRRGQRWRRADVARDLAIEKIRAQRQATSGQNAQGYTPTEQEIQQTTVTPQEVEARHQEAIQQILDLAPVQGTQEAHRAAIEFIKDTAWVDDQSQLSQLVDPSTGINPNDLLS